MSDWSSLLLGFVIGFVVAIFLILFSSPNISDGD